MNPKESCLFYKELGGLALNEMRPTMDRSVNEAASSYNRKKEEAISTSHASLFQVNVEHLNLYKSLYLDQLELVQQFDKTPLRRPSGDTCKSCENFHYNQPKTINKSSDITEGNAYEDIFIRFLNQKFSSLGVNKHCARADTENLHMPDLKIVQDDGKVTLYIELKAIFKPFLSIAKKVNDKFECYSNSLTLDIENGKKLLEQKKLVEAEQNIPTLYVYWYDLPCIKGIFWMRSENVYLLLEEQAGYDRYLQPGDYDQHGRKNSATKKLYLPLHKMSDFHSMFEIIKNI